MKFGTFPLYCTLPILNILTPETTHISAQQMRYAVDMVGIVRTICAVSNLQYTDMYLHLTKTHYC